jgi:protein-tyrosine phosphatase
MKKILFVCHGNICRSTMAECVFNDILERNSEKSISCDSAATSTEEIGNPVHYGTRNVLQRHGIPVGNHRARQMTYQDYKDFDLLIGMDSANIRNMTRIAGGDSENKIKKLLTF